MRQPIDYSENLLLNIDPYLKENQMYNVVKKISQESFSSISCFTRSPNDRHSYPGLLHSLGIPVIGNC